MNKVELEVLDIRNSEKPSDTYALVLKERNGESIILVMIGWNEAREIIMTMNKKPSKRPTTHDLFRNFADATHYTLTSIDIYRFTEGIFYAYLNLENDKNEKLQIDSRTSDAVTLALKYRAPIFMEDAVFQENAVDPFIPEETPILEEDDGNSFELYLTQQLEEMPVNELKNILEGAVSREDFELASKIHDAIKKRER